MRKTITFTLLLLALAVPAFAQSETHQVGEMTLTTEDAESLFKAPGYSPYAGRNFPTRVYWGDSHTHTNLSIDARAFGVTLGPEEAYRFARGEEVTSTHGERLRLSRPLDWLVIADHSDGIGAMNEIVAGNSSLLADPTVQDWHTGSSRAVRWRSRLPWTSSTASRSARSRRSSRARTLRPTRSSVRTSPSAATVTAFPWAAT